MPDLVTDEIKDFNVTTPLSPLRSGIPSAHLSTRIQDAIQQALETHRLVGSVVLLAHHGALIYQQAGSRMGRS